MTARTWSTIPWVCLLIACGPRFYEPCDHADECADVVPEGADAECVSTSGGGFCSWQCVDDGDCGDDRDDKHDFVCAPFESNPAMYCFPSCEGGGAYSDGGDCPGGYTCRSTGGGSDNRKVCYPDG